MTRCLILLLAATTTLLKAGDQPDWIKDLSPTKPGQHASLPPGVMEFEISWKGIVNSGILTFDYGAKGRHKPGVIVVRSKARSMGMGGAFFPYNGQSWSEINAGTLLPRLFRSSEKKDGEQINTQNRFYRSRLESKETTKRKGQVVKVDQHIFPHTPAYDIGSAILFIRSQKLSNGDEISMLLHPFNNPYLLKAKVLGREVHEDKKCIKLSLEMHKIDRETLQLRPYKKIKGPAAMWLSDDKLRVPVELRAKVFIGDIRATVSGYQKS